MLDIIGFGALNFDRLYKVESLIAGDDEIFIQDEHEAPGGSAANTIYALGRLGISAGFIGAVGDDAEGKMIIDSFTEVGVDTSGIIKKSESRTSLILGFVDSSGERALYVSPRASSELNESDINFEYVKQSKMILLSSFVDDAQLQLQSRIVESLPSDTTVIFSPGALYCKKGFDKLQPIMERTNILFVNAEEIEKLLGKTYKKGSMDLIKTGISTIAVTLGTDGCYIRTEAEEIGVPSQVVDVKDTTGAGDAFAAGFIWGYLKKKSLRVCGTAGNVVASSCIQELGARSGIPGEEELMKRLYEVQ